MVELQQNHGQRLQEFLVAQPMYWNRRCKMTKDYGDGNQNQGEVNFWAGEVIMLVT